MKSNKQLPTRTDIMAACRFLRGRNDSATISRGAADFILYHMDKPFRTALIRAKRAEFKHLADETLSRIQSQKA